MTERLKADANVIWGARIREEYKGKVRVMAIMTGVQSAQILGPSTQGQADRSRRALENTEDSFGFAGEESAQSDGGQDTTERSYGLDVVR